MIGGGDAGLARGTGESGGGGGGARGRVSWPQVVAPRPAVKLVPPTPPATPPHSGLNDNPYNEYGVTLEPSHAL
jgi:hypothetical protein